MESRACLLTPPTLKVDYQPQGYTEKIAGLDCYVVQRDSPSIGVISIYDAFGATVPGHLGLDLLASRINTVVIEPDILEGDVAKESWFPISDKTEEVASAWSKRKFYISWDGYIDRIRNLVIEARTGYGIERWGILGFCFGGKFTVMLSSDNTPFKASVQVHPGRMDSKDPETLTIPHRLMASKEEPSEVIEQYEAYFKEHPEKQCESKTYNQHHGWAASRARLDDPEGKEAFERAFTEIAEFFEKHL